MNLYEAMFLFDPTFGSSMENCETEVRRLMDRAGAELTFCRKWDERRLAFKVKGRKRGVYVLTYFKGEPTSIPGIERDIRISESILRALILRADGMTPEMMERAVHAGGEPATSGEAEGERPRPETRRTEDRTSAKAAPATPPEPKTVVADAVAADAAVADAAVATESEAPAKRTEGDAPD